MKLLLQAGADAADLPSGYGVSLLQTLLALAAVCVLAWAVLRWAAQRGLGLGASRGRLRVIERVPLSARHTLWLVQVGTKVLLIGTGDGASPTTLGELAEGELPEGPAKSASFVEVLRRRGPSVDAGRAERGPTAVPPQDEPQPPPNGA